MAGSAQGVSKEKTAGTESARPKKGKKALFLGGGILSLAAAAYALSLMAVPKKHGKQVLNGPFVADLAQDQYRVNLADEAGRHYLALSLKAEVDAYDETYTRSAIEEPLHQARLTDAVIRVSSQKKKSELDQDAGREVFRQELRSALEPILFPIHLGDPHDSTGQHAESGLRLGPSAGESTMRQLFYDHVLLVNAPQKTVKLDGGAVVSFRGDETDLEVADAQDRSIHLDVTDLHPDFVGELHVGVLGRVRGIYFSSFLTQ